MQRLWQKRNIVEYLMADLEKERQIVQVQTQSPPVTCSNRWHIAFIFIFAFFTRREKQSLERYLKEVPTVEEHQKLNKTISLKLCKFHINFLDIIKRTRRYLLNIVILRGWKSFNVPANWVVPRVADISLTRHAIFRLGEASDEPKQHLSEGGTSSHSLEALSLKYVDMLVVVVFNIFSPQRGPWRMWKAERHHFLKRQEVSTHEQSFWK